MPFLGAFQRVITPASGCDIQYHGKAEIGAAVVASPNNRYQPLDWRLRLTVKLLPFPVLRVARLRDWHVNQAMSDYYLKKQFVCARVSAAHTSAFANARLHSFTFACRHDPLGHRRRNVSLGLAGLRIRILLTGYTRGILRGDEQYNW